MEIFIVHMGTKRAMRGLDRIDKSGTNEWKGLARPADAKPSQNINRPCRS